MKPLPLTGAPDADTAFMTQALELSRRAKCWASPNPHVGCVLVRDQQVLGTGFTQPAGFDHAERMALGVAGDARGATAYVTLEPCSHWGRTPPCADALIEAGIGRVVCAIRDPNPQVAGSGLARLKEAGIQVEEGLLADAVREELKGFLLRMERGWGRVRLKLAASLDGRTAMASGESQWITGEAARADVQQLRAESSIILTGVGTVLADDCALTVRAEQLELTGNALERATYRAPMRVVLDSRGRTPETAAVLRGTAETRVMHGPDAGKPADERWVAAKMREGRLCLGAVMQQLGSWGANEVLVECGPTLAAGLFEAQLIDELVLYQAPILLGSTARPLVGLQLERLAEGVSLDFLGSGRVGRDLRISAAVNYAPDPGAEG